MQRARRDPQALGERCHADLRDVSIMATAFQHTEHPTLETTGGGQA